MYISFGILLVIMMFFFVFNHCRKKRIIKKICSMSMEEKCCELDSFIRPFGYCYCRSQDIFSCTIDAWQREAGYCYLYDRAAPHFNMVFDSEPVYFDYLGKTWMIEFWKGQYGINTGGEVGIYHADTIIPPDKRKQTLFKAASDDEMLDFSIRLFHNGKSIAHLCRLHWWLTAFCMGRFSKPRDLEMEICMLFPDCEMLCAFTRALLKLGYRESDIRICDRKICFMFRCSHSNHFGCLTKFVRAFGQWKNKWFCRIYCFVTRPFCLSIDRILYLYYYLPFAFRKMCRIHRYKKFKPKKKGYQ